MNSLPDADDFAPKGKPGPHRAPIRADDETADQDVAPTSANVAEPHDEPPESPEQTGSAEPVTADGEQPGIEGPPTAEALDELRRKAAERDDMEKRLKRVAADFANAQKRIEREARTRIDYAIQDFLRELLAVTDSLERALNAAEQSRDIDGFIEGMRLVDKQFHDILARHHVEPIPTVKGEPFDPEFHEVMAVIPTDEHPVHAVIEEVERGFRLKDRVVRPAKVVVAGPRPNAEAD